MNFACPNRVLPCDNPVEDVAVRNFTAEEPDALRFFSLYWPDPGAPGFPNTPGPNPEPNFCEADTQEAADLCATQPPFPGGGGGPQLFFSTAQPCTVNCSDGTTASFTAPASLFYATTQSAADALAFAFACNAANSFCGTPRPRNNAQTCDIDCPPIASYTVASNSFMGQSQADADAAAYALACAVAQQLCGGGPPPTIYSSAPQSCTVTCPGGTSATVTVPAGSALGLSQAESDASALNLACALATLSCTNIPTLIGNTSQTCTQNCGVIPVSYTVPAGAFLALDQASANFAAYLFACAAANQTCITGEPPPPITVGNTAQQCVIPCDGGSFVFTLGANEVRAENQAAANQQAASIACLIGQSEKVCLGAIDTTVCAGTSYASFISASGPVGTIVKTAGQLPPGLTLSGDGFIVGTANQAGTFSFTVQANSASGYTTRTYTIIVSAITSSALPNATNGEAYAEALTQVGMSNPVWSLQGGTLPAGLSLSSAGIIEGTPTESGNFSFVVQIEE